MKIIQTKISELTYFKPNIFKDKRGRFLESINLEIKKFTGIKEFNQTAVSYSKFGVFRGLHYQVNSPLVQFVQCIKGKVIDIACDLRESSQTFGKTFMLELNSETSNILFLPAGIAHGFLALSDENILLYNINGEYNKNFERGIHYKSIDIELPMKPKIINQRDDNWPSFNDAEYFKK